LPLFGKKKIAEEKTTKILFATDVHGSEPTFRKFINAGKIYGIDVLILGGDITGKMVIPIIKQLDGTFKSYFLGQEQKAKNEEELVYLEKRILTTGFYPLHVTQKEYEELEANEEKRKKIFDELMQARLRKWMEIAEERLKGTNIVCYITGGNDDEQEVVELIKDGEHVKNPDGKVLYIDDVHEMASLGWGNPTPWNTPRECSEEELKKRIEEMISKIKDMENAIFNFHIPPKDSELDTAPKLDTTVYPPKPVFEGGQMVFYGAGSEAVRKAIEKYQPLLGLHGHIHESKGARKIGRTLCINPGSEYGEGILRAALITIADKKIINYQFVSG